jgi:hypothetical protein
MCKLTLEEPAPLPSLPSQQPQPLPHIVPYRATSRRVSDPLLPYTLT